MQTRSLFLWHLSVVLFLMGLVAIVADPAGAGVGSGELQFSWGQVLVLVAFGVGWGDMRTQMRMQRDEAKETRDELKEMRKDLDSLKETRR